MFAFGLKKFQVWVTMALLLLCLLICPHSTYSYNEEADDPMDAQEENLENEEDSEAVQDEDEDSEEEHYLMEDTGVESDTTRVDPYPNEPNPPVRAKVCKKVTETCDFPYDCCPGLTCTSKKCVELKGPEGYSPPGFRT